MPLSLDKAQELFVEKTKDRLDKVFSSVDKLLKKEVLVGVPRSKNARTNDDDGKRSPLGNAAIAYIHDNGAPEANIPARPFMRPAIEASKDAVALELMAAARAALRGSEEAMDAHFERVGIIVVSAMKERIKEGIPPPLKPATVRARHRRRGTRMHESEADYGELYRSGASAEELMGTVKPLIDTAQLINALTYVVRPK